MKKLVALLLAGVIACLFMFNANAKGDIVRIHIRANSNSEQDQQIKLLVRDEINEYLAPVISRAKTKEEAIEILNASLPYLKSIAENTAGMPCAVTLGQEEFPAKTYNNKVYPAGEYTALIIEIGEGAGRNWWCVAFPSMCYTSSDTGKVEYKSIIVEFLERIGIL